MAWLTDATAEEMPAHLATSVFGTPTYSMSSGWIAYVRLEFKFLLDRCDRAIKRGGRQLEKMFNLGHLAEAQRRGVGCCDVPGRAGRR